MTKLCAWIWIVTTLLANPSSAARAQESPEDATRDEARHLGQEGIEAYWAEQFAAAEAKLDRAYALFPTPTLGLWSARARQKLGRWLDAVARYRETIERSNAVGDNAAQQRAQLDAKAELEQLTSRVPSISLSVAGHDLETVVVRVDGQLLPREALGTQRPVDPGLHSLEASRGDERYEQRVDLDEAQHVLATFSFSSLQLPAPPPAGPSLPPHSAATTHPSPQSPLVPISIAVLAAGGASLLASGVLAFVATNQRADDCPQSVCTSARAKDAYDALKTASTVTFYAGATLAMGGLVGWLLLGRAGSRAESRVGIGVSPSGLSVAARF
jgi:hypothetical protein